MQEAADATPSGMVSILGLERSKVEACATSPQAAKSCRVANSSVPWQHRHLGPHAACDASPEMATEAGRHEGHAAGRGRSVHTPIMRPADAALAAALADVPIETGRDPGHF